MADTHGRQPVRTLTDGDLHSNILNVADSVINPATEEKQDDLNADIAAIEIEQLAQGVSLDDINSELDTQTTEQSDQGTTLDGILLDTAEIEARIGDEITPAAGTVNAQLAAAVVDLAALEVESLDQGTTLDSILADTANIDTNIADIETELLDQGTTLDSILVAVGGAGELNPVSDFNTEAAVGADSDNAADHDFLIDNGTFDFYIESIVCSGSGPGKFTIAAGTVASEVTKWVVFTSESNPTVVVDCSGFRVLDGDNIAITRHNSDNQALDMYTTINGRYA
jgi:hypothetical protein